MKNIDFTYNGAYSIYNWELFFHAPLLIADPPEPEPEIPGRAELVPLHLQSHRQQPRTDARAFLESAAIPVHRRAMIEQILVNLSTNSGSSALQADRRQHQRLDSRTPSSPGPSPNFAPPPTCSKR